MTICFAATVLVHHHVMVVSTIILVLIILWQIVHHKPWRSLAGAVWPLSCSICFFFAYALHLANFRSTGMVVAGEPLLPLLDLPRSFGYALVCVAGFGVVLCLLRKIPCPPIVAIASLALVGMFVVGEDLVPMMLRALNRTAFTFFTPSRFLTDLNYFLPIFAAGPFSSFNAGFDFRNRSRWYSCWSPRSPIFHAGSTCSASTIFRRN